MFKYILYNILYNVIYVSKLRGNLGLFKVLCKNLGITNFKTVSRKTS